MKRLYLKHEFAEFLRESRGQLLNVFSKIHGKTAQERPCLSRRDGVRGEQSVFSTELKSERNHDNAKTPYSVIDAPFFNNKF